MGDRFHSPGTDAGDEHVPRAAADATRQRLLVDGVAGATGDTVDAEGPVWGRNDRPDVGVDWDDMERFDGSVHDEMLVEIDRGDGAEYGVVRAGFRDVDTLVVSIQGEGTTEIDRGAVTAVAAPDVQLFEAPAYDHDQFTDDPPAAITAIEDWDAWRRDHAFAGQELYLYDRDEEVVRRAVYLDGDGGPSLRIEGFSPESQLDFPGTAGGPPPQAAPVDDTIEDRFAVVGGQDWRETSRQDAARAVAKNVQYNLARRRFGRAYGPRFSETVRDVLSTHSKDAIGRIGNRLVAVERKDGPGGLAVPERDGSGTITDITLEFDAGSAPRSLVSHELGHAKLYAYDFVVTETATSLDGTNGLTPGDLSDEYNDARGSGDYGQKPHLNADGTIAYDFGATSDFGMVTDYMIVDADDDAVISGRDLTAIRNELQAAHDFDLDAADPSETATRDAIERGEHWTDELDGFEFPDDQGTAARNFARAANRALFRQQLAMERGESTAVRGRYSLRRGRNHYSAVHAHETVAQSHRILSSEDRTDAIRAGRLLDTHPELVAAYTHVGTLSGAVADEIGDELDDMDIEYGVD